MDCALNHPQYHNGRFTDDTVVYYFPGEGGCVLYCRDRENGELQWEKPFNWLANVRQIAYNDGKLYFLSKDNMGGEKYRVKIFCLDAETGEENWTHIPQTTIVSFFFSHHLLSFDETALYYGGTDSFVYKLDKETGETIWKAPSRGMEEMGNPDAVFSTVEISNGKVFTHASDDYVYCFDAETGDRLWASPMPEHIRNDPEVDVNAQDVYFVPDPMHVGAGHLIAQLQYKGQRSLVSYNMETGEYEWELSLDIAHFPSFLIVEEQNSMYVPAISTGITRVSLDTGEIIRHYLFPPRSDTPGRPS
ncbi:MAG: PQQ-binding-like beta-propeller repeat protein [Planctomycetota bacterium]|nr:PQQ-binding-like beta-propeller repeat protein [Planctomycetota bacterium]